MSVDLSTRYLGLTLAHPLVPGASPLCDDLDMVRRLEDAGEIIISGRGGEVLGQPTRVGGAHQRGDVVAPLEHPGQGELRGGASQLARQAIQPVDEALIARPRLTLEAREVRAEVRRVELLRERPGEEAAGQGTVGHHADPQRPGGREDLRLDAAGGQGVLDLQGGDRVDGVGPAELVCVDLGDAQAQKALMATGRPSMPRNSPPGPRRMPVFTLIVA